ncbi:ATP-dependent DNA helicase UvrD, putative [Plasmodium knowlesi strain H]|uniref:DNA 3'-5' helicase n=3 Tax=Plasmodium knowlesi TaxID=5850 RepID=A0A5K1U5S5_PLAKH|nr:ATP-dependent DNA helicase UvrD, putative [Plasmodium knowlesi strain H]OTN67125.1 putative ATP-dependent DNA helicase UvrD [Plasmodium knowlesi]CAA9988695.1 ATP-dependent DNA helicase UvrD, putative [Plasmodium knowlesi strain H]SBO21622.1 ATP-dependent DNA helicase UvrD, putative [Plasmodium knowlesi strain H]SBO21987.1 ATP-dependent DNA helicase UvrD, putative [Plasmodium knowlesi strain H]VVS78169.1 ATP-dependent DNA helicase UvrD, putative [Plasmodium knowlesi strain H]|eukprot:XP_002259672.1 helicase, belonging to UvrD family, putative [Plasmodium knowlesi strain H]
MKRRKGDDGDRNEERFDPPNARISLMKEKTWSSESMFNSILYSNLSREQIKIVQIPLNRNLCIIACPGSGKTSTLTARIIRSIIEKKKSLVCITFTKYAANDLKEKITKKVNCLIDLFIDTDMSCKLFADQRSRKKCDTSSKIYSKTKLKVLQTVMFIGTIHSFCRYILFKYKGPFKILTAFISSNVIKLAFNNFYASFLKGQSAEGVGLNCFGSGKDTGDGEKGSFDLMNFFSNLKEGFSKRDAQEIEDDALDGDGDGYGDDGDDVIDEDDYDDEHGDHFYNYLYHVQDANERKDYFEHGDIPSILKKKHILFLKKKIKLLKYVELYKMKIEMNDVEEKFYEEYKRILQNAKHIYYDFDDLLIETYRLMKEDEDIRNSILAEWHYMFCDEFQDINTTQFNILQFFANGSCGRYGSGRGAPHDQHPPNDTIPSGRGNSPNGTHESDRGLTVIGDDDQSIYSFRGAHINVFNKIMKEHNCLLFKLGTNFRSTKEIVRVSCNLILHNANCRIEKSLQTNNVQGEKVIFHAFKTNNDQVSFILCKIIFLKKKYSYKFSDFVILSRTNRSLRDTFKCMQSMNVRRRAMKFFHELVKTERGATDGPAEGDHHWTDITPDTFKIPIKELNKKKAFFGSKEIVELITVLRFLLNVDDDIILKKAFKIIKNDRAIRGILDKLERSDFGVTEEEEEDVYSTDTGGSDPCGENRPSLFNRIERITHSYILWKKKQLKRNEFHHLDVFTEEEIKKILDFFFCVNYFLKFASQPKSVYSLVMDILSKTGFVNRTLKRIRRRRNEQVEHQQDEEKDQRRKRSFEEFKDDMDENHPDLVNELKIKHDLRTHFGLSEEDLAEEEMQNIFVLLEMTIEYKPNQINEKCSDCLICFLNDFKNDIHDRMLVEKVTLTTIHKSKGLEWKVVFIVNAMEGEIPYAVENSRDIIEERKIFYVGITRAKFFLYLLCFLQNNHTAEKNTVSRFVSQMAI